MNQVDNIIKHLEAEKRKCAQCGKWKNLSEYPWSEMHIFTFCSKCLEDIPLDEMRDY